MAGLYIHIPFCRSRCIYCDFYSTTLPPAWQMPYVEALGKEMVIRGQEARGKGQEDTFLSCDVSSSVKLFSCPLTPYPFTSLYLGGGTPSQLTPEALRRLFLLISQHVLLAPDAEVTIEANPDDVTPEWIALLKDTPVNRISMGVQSLDDDILRILHRRHTARQAIAAVRLLQEAGYDNLSLDLIYGLPGQTLQQFTADVERLLSLGIPHLSAYALQFEEGTQLYRMRSEGIIREADEELSFNCYQVLIDRCWDAGMEHYEISNFARPGFRSRHNSSYWNDSPYVGLGAGAHSYDPQICRRSFNCEDMQLYIRSINEGRLPSETELLDDDTRYNERVMLRLRTCEGLSLSGIEHDFGPTRRQYCERMARPHLIAGRLQKKADETLSLTRQGLFVSDDIISDLVFIEDHALNS